MILSTVVTLTFSIALAHGASERYVAVNIEAARAFFSKNESCSLAIGLDILGKGQVDPSTICIFNGVRNAGTIREVRGCMLSQFNLNTGKYFPLKREVDPTGGIQGECSKAHIEKMLMTAPEAFYEQVKDGRRQWKTLGDALKNSVVGYDNFKAVVLYNEFNAPFSEGNAGQSAPESTPILDEIKKGNLQGVSELIQKEPTLIAKPASKSGFSPIFAAISEEKYDIFQALLQKEGASVLSRKEGGRKQTLLLYACGLKSEDVTGNLNAIKILIDRGANIYERSTTGNAAIHYAALSGKDDLITLLLSKGVPVDAKNAEGQTALFLAANGGHYQTVRMLLGHGANPRHKAPDGYSALLAAFPEGNEQVVKLLVQQGAEVDAVDNRGMTPIMEAALAKKAELVKFLAVHGASITRRDRTGLTPFHYASRMTDADPPEVRSARVRTQNTLNQICIQQGCKHPLGGN